MSAATQLTPRTHRFPQHLVEELQEERQEMWSLYCQIAQLRPFADTEELRPILCRFSQILIDYVSLCHFGIIECLLARKHDRDPDLHITHRLYPSLSNTTQSVVSFSQRYDDGNRRFRTDSLDSDLSKLGENLAKRMELEDRLCSILLH